MNDGRLRRREAVLTSDNALLMQKAEQPLHSSGRGRQVHLYMWLLPSNPSNPLQTGPRPALARFSAKLYLSPSSQAFTVGRRKRGLVVAADGRPPRAQSAQGYSDGIFETAHTISSDQYKDMLILHSPRQFSHTLTCTPPFSTP
ncbi:unnamed protein product [Pleuronectes platessa]|uniref:Uncharacterized protein n=1 Tax=Pleuronectes platessa TaxID=8262 RepID=A0A9N7YRW0_PLEPL|nr:unnamed protein product [Pleuronectes platessa]